MSEDQNVLKDVIEDASKLIKRVGTDELLYPADDPNFLLREKKLMRTPKDYSSLINIDIYNEDLDTPAQFPTDKVMLPNCSDPIKITSGKIYKVNAPGFIYAQRWQQNNATCKYTVYIDGGYTSGDVAAATYNPFTTTAGGKFLVTTDSYPDITKKYYKKENGKFIEVENIFTFSDNVPYYEKYDDTTYFTLFSSDNGDGARSNNMFPICPGKYTYILVNVTESAAGISIAFIPAAGYDNDGNLLEVAGTRTDLINTNYFTLDKAKYIFRK